MNKSPHYLVIDLSKDESDLLVGFYKFLESQKDQIGNQPGYIEHLQLYASISEKIETAKIAASVRVKR
jgi:hypothetical protein